MLDRAVCCAERAGRADWLAAWAEWILSVSVADRVESRASFWGLGGIGGGGALEAEVVVGRGLSKGEVRRSTWEGLGCRGGACC